MGSAFVSKMEPKTANLSMRISCFRMVSFVAAFGAEKITCRSEKTYLFVNLVLIICNVSVWLESNRVF